MTEEELMACAEAGYEAWWLAQNGYVEQVPLKRWADMTEAELDYWLAFAEAFEDTIPE